jgi:GNAT superfamily N-acetyltransferase
MVKKKLDMFETLMKKISIKSGVPLKELRFKLLSSNNSFYKQIETLDDLNKFINIENTNKIIIEDSKGNFIVIFRLSQMYNCCAICIFSEFEIRYSYRNKKIAQSIIKFAMDYSKKIGFTSLICTDVSQNLPMRHILHKFGWTDISTFKNERTGNIVNITEYKLIPENYNVTNVFYTQPIIIRPQPTEWQEFKQFFKQTWHQGLVWICMFAILILSIRIIHEIIKLF